MKKLVVATSHAGKLKEMQDHIMDFAVELALKPPELDVEETGVTFAENARLKASQTAIALSEWSIADDSGLEVMALNGQPGIYSARYGNTDQERIARLLRKLEPFDKSTAQFV